MRIARFVPADGGPVSFGVVRASDSGDGAVVDPINGHPFGEFTTTGQVTPIAEVRLLAPTLPSKIVAFGRTYADHARELGNEPATEPLMFLKPSTSVIGPGDAIALPVQSTEVHYEAELAVVIGRHCRDVPAARALEVVLGYTCANDVTARDLQRGDGQWSRAKGFDSFCPLGPWVVTDVDPSDRHIVCRVNGDVKQDGSTSDLTFSVAELIAWTSSVMTLIPGDVILTGTPAGVGPLSDGDTVEVAIDGIGTLFNRVVKRD